MGMKVSSNLSIFPRSSNTPLIETPPCTKFGSGIGGVIRYMLVFNLVVNSLGIIDQISNFTEKARRLFGINDRC